MICGWGPAKLSGRHPVTALRLINVGGLFVVCHNAGGPGDLIMVPGGAVGLRALRAELPDVMARLAARAAFSRRGKPTVITVPGPSRASSTVCCPHTVITGPQHAADQDWGRWPGLGCRPALGLLARIWVADRFRGLLARTWVADRFRGLLARIWVADRFRGLLARIWVADRLWGCWPGLGCRPALGLLARIGVAGQDWAADQLWGC